VHGNGGHTVHAWLCNVLYDYWNVEIPSTDCLVIRRGYKSSVFVYKGDCVYRTEVLIVLLCYFARAHIVLVADRVKSNLHDKDMVAKRFTWIIFLLCIPAKNTVCLSLAGWNLTTFGN
jgi:hypothetical protein